MKKTNNYILNNSEEQSNNEIFLQNMLNSQYEDVDVKKIYNGYKAKRFVTLRVNSLKTDVNHVKEVLNNNSIEFDTVPWMDEALIIKNRTEKDLQQLEIYENGEIYLQSLSSMLPPIALKPEPNEDILDMAAAPGGKTTEIAALTHNQANITACEMNAIRAERLRFNIEKQGANSVYVMQKDSRNIDDFFSFDKILLDAPCSGSGTLNLNDDNTFRYFSKRLVEKSAKTQYALLKKAIKILKPGKDMVYSTCSILSCENEEVVNKIVKEGNVEIVPIDFDGKEHLPLLKTQIPGTICVCPNELYEGFFIAKIRKIK